MVAESDPLFESKLSPEYQQLNTKLIDGFVSHELSLPQYPVLSRSPKAYEVSLRGLLLVSSVSSALAERVTPDQVINVCARYFGTEASEIIKPSSRQKSGVEQRHIAMFLVREMIDKMSYPSIAVKFGGIDHTTVMHGVKLIQDKAKDDGAVMQTIHEIRELITSPSEEGAQAASRFKRRDLVVVANEGMVACPVLNNPDRKNVDVGYDRIIVWEPTQYDNLFKRYGEMALKMFDRLLIEQPSGIESSLL